MAAMLYMRKWCLLKCELNVCLDTKIESQSGLEANILVHIGFSWWFSWKSKNTGMLYLEEAVPIKR